MFDFLGDTGSALLTVFAPVALGLVQKHATKIPNNAIPYVNGALGTVVGTMVSGDIGQGLAFGATAAYSGTGIHQILKVGLRSLTKGKVQSL